MIFNATPIEGVVVVDTSTYRDSRGEFARLFCERELQPVIRERKIVQINRSRTTLAGAIRGMHFQRAPHAEMKLVRCLNGRVWDVAIDLRRNSRTFLKWHGEELSPGNARMVVIPEGCAHGFQALEPECELLYLHTAAYTPAAEGGVRYDDPALAINWPLVPTEASPRDMNHPVIGPDFQGLHL